jgi:hypothetical protein
MLVTLVITNTLAILQRIRASRVQEYEERKVTSLSSISTPPACSEGAGGATVSRGQSV